MPEKPRSMEKSSRSSSQESAGEAGEENVPTVPITDIIPNKGREIPRTPTIGSTQDLNQTYQTDEPFLSVKTGKCSKLNFQKFCLSCSLQVGRTTQKPNPSTQFCLPRKSLGHHSLVSRMVIFFQAIKI